MASKLRLQEMHIGLDNRGMIKTDQHLATFAAKGVLQEEYE